MPHRDDCAYVAALNQTTLAISAAELTSIAHQKIATGRLALVSSIDVDVVLFIDTTLLFDENLKYQRRISTFREHESVRTICANPLHIRSNDPRNMLNLPDTKVCHHIKQTAQLDRALATMNSGPRQSQSKSRTKLICRERALCTTPVDTGGDPFRIKPNTGCRPLEKSSPHKG